MIQTNSTYLGQPKFYRDVLRQLFIHPGTYDKRQPQVNGLRPHCVLCTLNGLSRFMRNPTGQ